MYITKQKHVLMTAPKKEEEEDNHHIIVNLSHSLCLLQLSRVNQLTKTKKLLKRNSKPRILPKNRIHASFFSFFLYR